MASPGARGARWRKVADGARRAYSPPRPTARPDTSRVLGLAVHQQAMDERRGHPPPALLIGRGYQRGQFAEDLLPSATGREQPRPRHGLREVQSDPDAPQGGIGHAQLTFLAHSDIRDSVAQVLRRPRYRRSVRRPRRSLLYTQRLRAVRRVPDLLKVAICGVPRTLSACINENECDHAKRVILVHFLTRTCGLLFMVAALATIMLAIADTVPEVTDATTGCAGTNPYPSYQCQVPDRLRGAA